MIDYIFRSIVYNVPICENNILDIYLDTPIYQPIGIIITSWYSWIPSNIFTLIIDNIIYITNKYIFIIC